MLGKGSTGEFDREGKGREGVPPHERGLGGQKRGEASALTPTGGGGGYLGTECIPTAKRPTGAEAVNVKI